MNALRNRVLLIGRLGQDPERIEFDGEKVKASLRLATNEVYRNADGEKTETTQWHNIIAWGQLADIMTKYLSKGNEVAIEGRLVYRQYEDKMGQQRVTAEIVTQEMLMLDRPMQGAKQAKWGPRVHRRSLALQAFGPYFCSRQIGRNASTMTSILYGPNWNTQVLNRQEICYGGHRAFPLSLPGGPLGWEPSIVHGRGRRGPEIQ